MKNGTGEPDTHDEAADWERLARYLAGESPPGEAESVRAWLAEDPARRERVATLDGALERAVFTAPANLDVEAALRRVHGRMDEAPAAEPDVRVIPLRPPVRRTQSAGWWNAPALRIAAMLVLLLGGAYVLARVFGDRSPAAREFATAVGERDSLRLSDGTRVLLGPGSRLTVAAGYGEASREVELRGEALFDVPHDDSRPFTVHAGGASVRDLGTAFSVHTGRGEAVRVVVTSGAVVLHAAGAPAARGVVLRQGDRGAMEEAGRVTAERAAATADDLAWTRGRLVFQDAPFTQVASDLRRWYGLELRAGDAALSGRRLTAAFQDEPPERVLQVVALALGAEVEMRGDTAVLRASGSEATR